MLQSSPWSDIIGQYLALPSLLFARSKSLFRTRHSVVIQQSHLKIDELDRLDIGEDTQEKQSSR